MLRTARWVTGSALRDLVLFALVWGWMVQLLIPFGEATKIPEIKPFLLFLGILFAIDYLISNRFGRIAMKFFLLCAFLYYNYYTQVPFYEPKWLLHWATELYFSVSLALHQQFNLMPDSAYTTVFVLVLILFQSLFRQSLKLRTWMLTLLILGSIGLGVLDTFYVSNDKPEIVLYILFGLLLLAGMQLPLIERTARMPHKMRGWPIQWLSWTLVLALIVVGTSTAVPKQLNATWPDPVAFLQSKVAKGPVHQKIGYSSDDSHLGGPFDMDDTPVFTVITNTDSYYRGETKIIYTGKGWLSASMGQPVQDLTNITAMQQHESTSMETKKVVQTYTFQKDMYPVVFNQYHMTGVNGVANNQNVTYSDYDQRLMLGELKAGTTYVVTSQVPIIDTQLLETASVPGSEQGFAPYLILPSEVPSRVKTLAQQITKDAKTPFERATGLESYLRQHYTYDTTDVPVPGENQDFVDQFLFETKKGYCDHFSSAFVVMAREIGLPARWVKGFTQGDTDLSFTAKTPGEHKYVVENKNAHAWAEVYFDGIGWVPFEPTATFAAMPRLTKELPDTQTIAPVVPTPQKKLNTATDDQDPTKTTTHTVTLNWQAIGIDAIYLFVLLLIVAFFFRRKLMTWYYVRRLYKGDDATAAMNRLITVMARFGWRRPDDMTLREFAAELSASHELRGREMIPLTKLYERVHYGQENVTEKEKSQVRDLWTRMIRKAGRFKKK